MQQIDEKTLFFKKVLGETIEKLRVKNGYNSRNKFADEYALNDSNLGKIENAIVECKFITLWKIIEALDIDPIEFIKLFKEKLGKDFSLIEK